MVDPYKDIITRLDEYELKLDIIKTLFKDSPEDLALFELSLKVFQAQGYPDMKGIHFRRMEASSIEDLNTKLAILIVSITYTAQNAKKGQALTGVDIATIEQAANDIERLALKFQQLTQQGVTFPLLVELS